MMTIPEIRPELCELVGAIIGNGNLWTDGSRFRIDLTGHPEFDKSYFEYLRQLMQRLFGKDPYPLRIRQRGLRLRLQSKTAYELLLTLGIPQGSGKSHKVTIPDQIAQDWELAKWAIRGIVDTDGTVFFSTKTYDSPIYPTIEIRTCSKKLADQIETLLEQKNFRARTRGNDKEGFHVALYGKEMLRKWSAEIGFSNSKHTNKIVLGSR